jgi:hypothetical protein
VKLFRILMVAVGCLLGCTTLASAQSFEAKSSWKDQQGSSLTIQSVAKDGSFTGTYVSHAGAAVCRDLSYPAIGWIDGQKITFSVRWTNAAANCQAITSWTGFLGPRGMLTEWVLVSHGKSGAPALSLGKDIFTAVPQTGR